MTAQILICLKLKAELQALQQARVVEDRFSSPLTDLEDDESDRLHEQLKAKEVEVEAMRKELTNLQRVANANGLTHNGEPEQSDRPRTPNPFQCVFPTTALSMTTLI